MRCRFHLLSLLTTAWMVHAQTAIPLWPEAAPGARGTNAVDIPTITPHPAETTNGPTAAMVIFPGGGYGGLAAHEGKDYAEWFATNGISAFVVKYRLGSHGYRHPVMLQDAARAVRWVRAHAEQWRIDPKRVGVIGSSAGGHLASTLSTHFDPGMADASDAIERQSSRPDLAILCYPVITMGANTHLGSRRNLLGDNPDAALVHLLSNERQVTSNTPPCFIWHTWEDKAVKVENALDFASALQRSGVPFDLHIYQQGAHGLGLGKGERHPWTADCLYWLRVQRFVR